MINKKEKINFFFFGIHPQTLRKLGDQQKIKCYRTITGQRKFNRQCLEKMLNGIYYNDKI